MKPIFFIILFFISFIGFAQNNYIVKTEDGRRVLLKADYTWEYIDMEISSNNSPKTASIPSKKSNCNITKDFVEPKLNAKIQSQLKKGRATIDHVKKKVAKDYDCSVDDITLLSFKEQKEKATYNFCVKGAEVTYKRIGHSIVKKSKFL